VSLKAKDSKYFEVKVCTFSICCIEMKSATLHFPGLNRTKTMPSVKPREYQLKMHKAQHLLLIEVNQSVADQKHRKNQLSSREILNISLFARPPSCILIHRFFSSHPSFTIHLSLFSHSPAWIFLYLLASSKK